MKHGEKKQDSTEQAQVGESTAEAAASTEAVETSGLSEIARAEAAEIAQLKAALAEKDDEINRLQDRYLRTLADSENMRKRLRQQAEEMCRLERENLLRLLLPVIDDLERAVQAASGGGNGKSIIEGVEMVVRALFDFLRAQGVTPQQALGKPFDPQLHEAVEQLESEEHPPNTVVKEFHRGYHIGDRVLRPARVAVARTAAHQPPAPPAQPRGRGNGSDKQA